ncbi:unnamed protein product [Owenia fusiformis]|uniref:D-aminoacyl-tRNA deacylase n=1 Tax=Owenia fusiformis TaxID=6347 RepID=A0A8J1U6B0_OWEFU|nr:unnamed protein product [Owenia fusiformis]
MSSNSQPVGLSNARVVMQQCLSARLQVKPPSDTSEAEYVEIGKGLLIYLCFLKDATVDIVDRMVKTILGVKLSESDDGKYTSILDLPGDVLIIPQATLGGKIKGKQMQYHGNVAKQKGQELYSAFIEQCELSMKSNAKCSEGSKLLKFGTYGNRQVLSIVTNGPYTHLIEF